MAAADPRIDEILSFWFRDCRNDPEKAAALNREWFGGGDALDETIRTRFASTIDAAAAGELSEWRESTAGRLALILLLDQFPRNVHRGTARAFAFDEQAREISKSLIERGLFELSPPEQVFAILPLMHSEELADQERSLEIFDRCVQLAPPAWQPLLEKSREFARDHHNVVARFGRFPQRNATLGRTSTGEEEYYLASEAKDWGQ
jgi:uncharacterized protein (DUF924 family)